MAAKDEKYNGFVDFFDFSKGIKSNANSPESNTFE